MSIPEWETGAPEKVSEDGSNTDSTVEKLKGFYYSVEDKWYSLLDKVDDEIHFTIIKK